MTSEPKLQELHGRLRFAREQAGLSQGQSAALMGMHRPTVSEIEAGRRKVTAEELREFARHYGVAVEWLLGERVNEETLHASVRLAARELARLKKDDLDKILQLISTLKSTAEPDDEP